MSDSAMEWAVERERELRKWSYLEYRVRDIGLQEAGIFACESPEEQWIADMERQMQEGLAREAYPFSDPKHPDFHSLHADLWGQPRGQVTIIAAWVVNVHSPDVVVSDEDLYWDLKDERLLANLPAMIEQAEENLQDLMPEGYKVTIKEWNSE